MNRKSDVGDNLLPEKVLKRVLRKYNPDNNTFGFIMEGSEA